MAVPFSARELDVLEAMATGLDCKGIAHTLGISECTVRKHRSNMLARSGTRNAAALVAHARALGLLNEARAPPTLRAVPA